MEESLHAAEVVDCKNSLWSRKVKEELIIKDEVVEEPLLFDLVKEKIMVEGELQKKELHLAEFEPLGRDPFEEGFSKSCIGSVEERATLDEALDCKNLLLLEIRKEDFTTGDEVPKEGPYLDEFSAVKEEVMEERILENVNPQLPSNRVTSLKGLKEKVFISPETRTVNEENNVTDSSLKPNMLTHSYVKQFKCSDCDYECKLKKQLKEHMFTHSDLKPFKCSNCDYECSEKSQLKEHMSIHYNIKQFRCSQCGYECNQKSNMKQHMLTHSKVKQFRCSDCDYECNRRGSLKQHMLTHSNIKQFRCSDCDYASNQKINLKHHVLTHSTVKQFKCTYCDFASNRKGNLKRHLLIHGIC